MKKQIKKFVVLALSVGMLATTVLGASAAFDPAYYAAQNPDVIKALGNSPEMLKKHYDLFGRKEARMSNKNDVEAQLRRLFNEKEYAALYPDVKDAFGADKEMMFQHYIAFGLLEARRPSEKVSQAAAASMKKTVETAMKNAGLAATPGSLEVVAVITGETAGVASAGDVAIQQALTQVAEVVAKEVTATVEEIKNPTPVSTAPSSGASAPSSSTPTHTDAKGDKDAAYLRGLINDVSANEAPTVKLDRCINLEDGNIRIDWPNEKSLTIDLNGHTITGNTYIFFTKTDLTLKNGTITCENKEIKNAKDELQSFAAVLIGGSKTLTIGDGCKITAKKDGVNIYSGAKLKVEKQASIISTSTAENDYAVTLASGSSASELTVEGYIEGGNGIYVNGSRTQVACTITIKDATVIAKGGDGFGAAIYLGGLANTTITNSTIKGTELGIEIRAGELTINSGTIESTYQTVTGKTNGDGSTIQGVPLAVSQHVTNLLTKATVKEGVNLKTASEAVLVVTNEFHTDGDDSQGVSATIDKVEIETGKLFYTYDDNKLTIDSTLTSNKKSGNENKIFGSDNKVSMQK